MTRLGNSLFVSLMLTVVMMGGCKTDCEKLWDHNAALREKAGDDNARTRSEDETLVAEFKKACAAFTPEQIACALAADAHKTMSACFEKPKKKGEH